MRLAVLLLTGLATLAAEDVGAAMTAAEEARALVGIEYVAHGGERISDRLSCIYEGGGNLIVDKAFSDDWAFGDARCNGRHVLLLERKVGEEDGYPKWRILDALVLPRYDEKPIWRQPRGLQLHMTGDCELDGSTETVFFALVRWGKRQRVDWRTGVKQAWGFDMERGRIFPLSTKRVVCIYPDEP